MSASPRLARRRERRPAHRRPECPRECRRVDPKGCRPAWKGNQKARRLGDRPRVVLVDRRRTAGVDLRVDRLRVDRADRADRRLRVDRRLRAEAPRLKFKARWTAPQKS